MPSQQHEDAIIALVNNPLDPSLSFPEQRAYYERTLGGRPFPADIAARKIILSNQDAELLSVDGADHGRIVLHLHGGGYVLGSSTMFRDFGCSLSRATRSPVLIPNYRLAPENPFPAALDDAVEAYQWLLDEGYPAANIVLSGDSAGGGLALACMLRLRDASLPMPACAILLSPWTDLALTGESCQPGAIDDPLLGAAPLSVRARHYAGGDLENPLVSPRYGQMHGLPPSLVFAGTREILVDDARRLVTAMQAENSAVEYIEKEGLIHCWQVLAPAAPETAESFEQIGAFINRRLSEQP